MLARSLSHQTDRGTRWYDDSAGTKECIDLIALWILLAEQTTRLPRRMRESDLIEDIRAFTSNNRKHAVRFRKFFSE